MEKRWLSTRTVTQQQQPLSKWNRERGAKRLRTQSQIGWKASLCRTNPVCLFRVMNAFLGGSLWSRWHCYGSCVALFVLCCSFPRHFANILVKMCCRRHFPCNLYCQPLFSSCAFHAYCHSCYRLFILLILVIRHQCAARR